jgi:hypothetical protein
MRILNFDGFSALYEADQPVSDETKSLIRRIVTSFGTSYGSMSSIAPGYKDVLRDLDSVLQAEDGEKIEKLKEIVDKISKEVAQPYKDGGVDTAWKEAAGKTIESLETLATQYEGEEAILKAVFDDVVSFMNGYKEHLIKSKQEATKAEAAVKESEIQSLNEGLFTTKKGNARSLMKQAVTLKAELETAAEDPGLSSFVSGQLETVKDYIQRLAELQSGKRKEIDNEELDKIGEDLNKIPQDLNAKIESLAKANKANKEAAMIYVKAIDLIDKAIEKELEVTKKLQDAAAEEAKKKEEEEKEKEIASRFSIDRDLDPDKISARRVNSDVEKFQELVLDKFKNYEPFEDFDLYQKFERYGADGKFGPTTRDLVVALKAGYGLRDDSDIITQELITKIYEEPLNESAGSYIMGFDSFQSDSILEAFDPNKAKRAPRKSGGGSGGSSSSGESDQQEDSGEKKSSWDDYPCVVNYKGAEKVKHQSGETVYRIDGEIYWPNGRRSKDGKMVNYSCDDEMFAPKDVEEAISEVEELLLRGNEIIEELYDDTDYWAEFKSTFNDDEEAAVADVFGSSYGEKGTWWRRQVMDKYVGKADDLINKGGKYSWLQKEDSEAYEFLSNQIDKFEKIYKTLKEKTYGGTGNDSYTWSMKMYDGAKKTFSVDTDF